MYDATFGGLVCFLPSAGGLTDGLTDLLLMN